jgi:hypothetical protein
MQQTNYKQIILIVVGVILLGLGYFYQDKIMAFFDKKKTELRKDVPPSTNSNSATTSAVSNSSSGSDCTSPIQSPVVVDGKIMGVVEVGASGFNAFAVKMDAQGNYETVYKDFDKSLALEGFATYEDVKTKLQAYLSKLFERGVSPKNMHFVISSGALKNSKTKIIADGLKKMGYFVNEVTAEQEGRFALLALLPKGYADNSFVVDIGSGNTKISYIENGRITTYESFGAKYYQSGIEDGVVSKELNVTMNKIPNKFKDNMFIIGGVPYELAKLTCEGQRYVKLKAPNQYSQTDNVKFNSGLNIYNYIYTNAQPKQVVFDYDTNFVIGFLISLKR